LIKYTFAIILGFFLFFACNDSEKHTKIHSFPEWNEEKYKEYKKDSTLYLFLTGGFSESLFSKTELKPNTLPKQMPHAIKVGGMPILKSYLNTIKERLPESALIFGMTGTKKEKSELKKRKFNESIKSLSLDALLLTQKVLPIDHKVEADESYNELPWLNSNILSLNTGKATELLGNEPFKIFEKNGIKVGVLGATSYQQLSPTERNNINGYFYEDPVSTILRHRTHLKKKGVDIIVLLLNSPVSCQKSVDYHFTLLKDLKKTEQICDKNFEAITLLDQLPLNAIDIIFTNQPLTGASLHRGVPIISTYQPEKFISGLRLIIEKGKINLEESLLLPHIKLCHQVFIGTQDCIFKTESQDFNQKRFSMLEKSAFGLTLARFMGKEIKEDTTLLENLNRK